LQITGKKHVTAKIYINPATFEVLCERQVLPWLSRHHEKWPCAEKCSCKCKINMFRKILLENLICAKMLNFTRAM